MPADFYVTLPSNASKDIFPKNSLGEFRVKLQNPIDTSKYDVGLTEIQYPSSWLTITDSYFMVSIDKIPPQRINLLNGRYLKIEKLIDACLNSIKSLRKKQSLTLSYDKHTMIAQLHITHPTFGIQFSRELCTIFGFNPEACYRRGRHKGSYPADLDKGMTALYVYSDIIENQRVGGSSVPLLRTIPLRTGGK